MPGSIAPLVMGWQRRMASNAGPLGASGEANNGNPVQIELWINGTWVDITAYVMVRDEKGNISVTRGRRDEGSTTEQSTCQMTLNNRDGRWSPRNPVGAYYGLIGRNQPVRVSVPDGLGGKSYRFQGEISVWPQSWDTTSTDVWTEVEGSGILRRLAQGPPPARSVLYTALTSAFNGTLLAYWPMEDAEGSLTMSTPLVTGSLMTFTGSPTLASFDGFPSSDPLPLLNSTSFTGNVAKFDASSTTGYQMRYLLNVPSDGFTDLNVISRMQVSEVTAGVSLLNFFDIHYNAPAGGIGSYGGTGTLSIQPKDGDEASMGSGASITMDVRGRKLWVSQENSISGSTLTVTLRVLDIEKNATDSVSLTLTSTSLSRVVSMILGPVTLGDSAGVSGAAAGHLVLQNSVTSITDLGRALQPNGETAGRRVERMCAENAIPFETGGNLDDSTALGNQGRINPLSLMQEAELADGGMLYESMPMLGLGYRPRSALLNQDAQLTLNYSGFNLSEIPTPVEDDRYIQNQVTVTVNDVAQTYSLTQGTLSTAQPPAGVGVYGTNLDLNLQSFSDGLSQAAWRVHLGTVDEPRYPEISVNLAHSSFTANPALKQAVLGLKQGDRIVVQNMPSWLPPGDVDQIILGFNETITHFEHRIAFICAPASPYEVGVLDDNNARIDTDGSELLSAATSTDTSLVVVPSAGQSTLWTKDTADFPLNVRVGGEVITVSGVTDWLSDTFTRSVSSSWGTPDTGSAWSTVGGGVASDYAVNGSAGIHTLSTVDETRRTSVTALSPDFDLYCDITTSALASGDSLYGAVTARMLDSGNMYMARLEFTTSNTIVLVLRRLVADASLDIGTYTLSATHAAGTYIRVRFQGTGSLLRAKAYPALDSIEEPAWHVSGIDSSLSNAYSIGTRSIRVTGNTNLATVAIQYDNYRIVNPQTFSPVTRSVNGIVKAQAVGADVRLATPTIISL